MLNQEQAQIRDEIVSRAEAVGRSEREVEESIEGEFFEALAAEGRSPEEGASAIDYFVEAGYSAENVLQVAGIDDSPRP